MTTALGMPLFRRELIALLRTRKAFWLLFTTVALSCLISLTAWPRQELAGFAAWQNLWALAGLYSVWGVIAAAGWIHIIAALFDSAKGPWGSHPIRVNPTWSRTGEQRTGKWEWAMSSLLATCAGGFRGGSQDRGSDSEFKQPLCDVVALHSLFSVFYSPFSFLCSPVRGRGALG